MRALCQLALAAVFLPAAALAQAVPVAAAPVAAGSEAAATAQTAPATTLRLSSSLVFVPVQVETRKGDILYDLKPEQFVVTDNGVPQTIRIDEDADSLGLSLVVVVQCSRTAYAEFGRMQGLGTMVDALTGGAPRQVALVSYGAEPELLTPFTASPDKLADGFSNLQPCQDGAAATLDAVNYAIHLFDDNKATAASRNRRAILLISEAHDKGSRTRPEQVIANLGRTNTVVDSVSFEPGRESILEGLLHGGPGPGAMGLLTTAVQALRKNVPHTLAELSGGEYTTFASEKKFDRGVNTLANHIHNFYLVSFAPSAPAAPGLHRIVVKVPDYADAHILARETYYQGDEPPPELPEKSKKKLF